LGKLGEAITQEQLKKGPPCDTDVLLSTMDEEDSEDLKKALMDKSIAATIIQAKLDQFGYSVGVTSLRRHRNRMLGRGDACSCQV
jgi:hypothetical protein